jgi:Putative phage abortive infection protein
MVEGERVGNWQRSLWVPVIGLAFIVIAWCAWLSVGMVATHRQVLRHAALAASAPTASPAATTDRQQLFAELGQSGDAFGGLNAALTGIAGGLVAWAGLMQRLMLKEARSQAIEERRARKLQEFEGLFFRLLELSSSITNKLETDPMPERSMRPLSNRDSIEVRPTRQGASALASFASSLCTAAHRELPRLRQDRNAQLEKLVSLFLTEVYDRKPSAFGPYFRILFQTFRHISDSDLKDEEQVKYANIARGQISEGAVLLLALNGLTIDGYKFVPLIEKFGLLEHLHRRYKQEFKALLSLGYRERAFLGSVERSSSGNEWLQTPKLSPNHFETLEHARRVADEESEFLSGFTGDDNANQ